MKAGWEWVECPSCESVFQASGKDMVIRCPYCKQYIDVMDDDPSDDGRGN